MTDQLVIPFDTARNYKRAGTSQRAAESIAPRSGSIRYRILAALAKHGPMTPDQTAARIGNGILGVRPRFSELRRTELIRPTGTECRNDSGLNADEYEITEAGLACISGEGV